MADPSHPQVAERDIPPDIMNDPKYATNNQEGTDADENVDTCRICRGDGSDLEPLFHPCKCSGSIKFVHQDCLMEWLSHSQKKHCELCKTPFRFTKLYSPNMPQSLPLPVLLRHMVIHTGKNVATWLRFCMVIAVWLGFLPYIIRQVWRLLFWFSDGGWPTNAVLTIERNSTGMDALLGLQVASLAENGTSPASPLQANPTTSASIAGVVDVLIGLFTPISRTLNISSADPLAGGLFKSLAYGLGLQPSYRIPDGSNLQPLGGVSVVPKYSSLLSEVSFLRNLTRHPSINQLVITIAEGYIITILVVVAFILVFLIREWVVQQQPGINMGAGFNAEFAAAERPREQAVPEAVNALGAVDNEGLPDLILERQEAVPRPMARARRRPPRQIPGNGGDEPLIQPNLLGFDDARTTIGAPNDRPVVARDAFTNAAEINRAITEEPRMTEEFLAIWRRADSNPKEVLRIIERENKTDQMGYWVNAMKILATPGTEHTPRRPSTQGASSSTIEALERHGDVIRPASTTLDLHSDLGEGVDNQKGSGRSSSSDEGWIDIPEISRALTPDSSDLESSTMNKTSLAGGSSKGKNIAVDQDTVTYGANSMEPTNVGISKPIEAKRFVYKPSPETRNNAGSIFPVPDFAYEAPSKQIGENDGPKSAASGFIYKPTLETAKADIGASSAASKSLFANASNLETMRPRATSDGPFRRTISPLAYDNNWSFSSMQVELDDEESSEKNNGDPLYLHPDLLPDFGERLKGSEDDENDIEYDARTAVEDDQSAPQVAEENGPIEITGEDGVVRTHRNWDDVFEANPIHDTDSGADEEAQGNPFNPDVPLPPPRAPLAQRLEAPQGILGTVADYLWGDVDDIDGVNNLDELGANDEHVVQDLAAEAPFVPIFHPADEANDQIREIAEAGIDLNDPDAIDDAEDFEGIMELVGMRGPIFSLVQNALFSAFLLALTVAFGVWIPYNIGRVSLLLIANPGPAFKLPLKLIFGCAALLQDIGLTLMGLVSYCVVGSLSIIINIWLYYFTNTKELFGVGLTSAALDISRSAFDRILDGALSSIINITDSEIFAFSAASHESLIMLRTLMVNTLETIDATVRYAFAGHYAVSLNVIGSIAKQLWQQIWQLSASLPALLARPDSWVISLEVGIRQTPLNLDLSVWDGWDRFWAITTGYTVLFLLGAMYVKKGTPFSNGQVGREWEATIIDLLNQAGGVMKVILIISIEMLVFPLYCGLLLDAALLPLFENTTIMSRLLFTFQSPLTSIFVHWFVGTCYMFHFALFVSMCRKIMRKGVLYFIRDPDDPTFHPVRDVLERNVATQLRKILFSALVYGGLVVVCLGGVVWGIAYTFKGVLPIHWSSNEPVLEFPVDLLFYNFLMPLAVKFFKPSDGLHTMYTWWFRQCARMLRLTWFMFDERKLDEEGVNIRRTWGDVLRGVTADPTTRLKPDYKNLPFEDDPDLRAYVRQDGRYVRAPASDQVRIPKGTPIFLEVDENNKRLDKKRDRKEGVHGSANDLYKQVYIPPWFQVRIFLFIVSIWLFAALTGVSITIVPLVFGRHIFAKIIPPYVRKNDVYAFSIGIYILGSALYTILNISRWCGYFKDALAINAETPQNILRKTTAIVSLVARIAWTYAAFLFLLPTLFAFVVEMYFITPIHTYLAVEERHVVHFVQSWTLGLLYVKLTTRFILSWYTDSRIAQSLRAITRDGYFNPDAKLATRSFILPVSCVLGFALVYPWLLAKLAVSTMLRNEPEKWMMAYRYAYPFCMAMAWMAYSGWVVGGWLKDWRMKIRDEVYLIGERLHNFGDRKTSNNGSSIVPNVRRLDT